MSHGREPMLRRIREALRSASDSHLRRPPPQPADGPADGPAGYGAWLPAAGEDYAARKGQFLDWCQKLKTELICLPSVAALPAELSRLARQCGWRKVATHQHRFAQQIQSAVPVEWLWTEPAYDPAQLEACDAGLTGCDAMIAQTGSVLVTSASAGGRALSVLPPHHVVLATADQLLADLPAGFALLRSRYAEAWPSFLSLITGPSRTGDIERILVLGAHGPKRLTVLLVEEADPTA